MKYLYFPDTLRYAGTVSDEADVPYCLNVPPPAEIDTESVIEADLKKKRWNVRRPNDAEIDAARALKVTELSNACAIAIIGGFSSDALGAAHAYPAKPTDQTNLQASVVAALVCADDPSWSTPFWCADEKGAWDWRLHTGDQIKRVGLDAKSAALACMAKNQALAARVASAKTIGEINAVVWEA
jgi:hypothetical protein